MEKLMKNKKNWLCVIGVWTLGISGGIFSYNAREYYTILNLPAFAPPARLFGPVWTILYLLMGITLAIIVNLESKEDKKLFLQLFISQFILNYIWSPVFFLLKNNLLATVIITALLIVLIIFQVIALKKKTIIGILMTPYFLWVSFATLLTYGILFLN